MKIDNTRKTAPLDDDEKEVLEKLLSDAGGVGPREDWDRAGAGSTEIASE
jgi:hypothetical protein